MPSSAPDNANPVIHTSQASSRRAGGSGRSKSGLDLDDDDEWARQGRLLSRQDSNDDDEDEDGGDLWVDGEMGTGEIEEIDQDEIFGKHRQSQMTSNARTDSACIS